MKFPPRVNPRGVVSKLCDSFLGLNTSKTSFLWDKNILSSSRLCVWLSTELSSLNTTTISISSCYCAVHSPPPIVQSKTNPQKIWLKEEITFIPPGLFDIATWTNLSSYWEKLILKRQIWTNKNWTRYIL